MSRDNSAPPCRPVWVLGIDRSGTSLVSDLIHRWGAYAGDADSLGGADVFNPQGYFEYSPMQALLHEVAVGTDVTEWDPRFPALLQKQAFNPELREKALALVAEMEKEGRPWLWKEPFISLHMSFWERIVSPPVCVMTVRNPHDSASSFTRMGFRTEVRERLRLTSYFSLRWQVFMLAILDYLERNDEHLVVCYESLLREPAAEVDRLCRFLDRCFDQTQGGAERSARMVAAIDPKLWRYKEPTSFFDVPEATEAQKELLRYLHRRAADQRDPFDPARYPYPPHYQEYLDNFDQLVGYLQERSSKSQP